MSLSPSLGMWKDSAVDLANLVKSKESMEASDHPSTNGKKVESNKSEGESSEVSLGFTRDSFLDLAGLSKRTSSTESVKAVNESEHSVPDSTTSSGLPPSDTSAEDVEEAAEQQDGRYSAFQEDYSDYAGYAMEYNVDPYAPTVFGERKGSGDGFWCCLFAPWFGGKKEPDKIEEEYDDDNDDTSSAPGDQEEEKVETSASREEDDVSSAGSEMYGEKLTDQDHLAAMARLRVAEIDHFEDSSPRRLTAKELSELPYKNVPFDSSTPAHAGLELEKSPSTEEKTPVKKDEPPKKLRPILKHGSTGASSKSLATTPRSKDKDSGQRRSLFATTYEKKSPPRKQHARFAPMARVISIKSCNEMSFMEKSSIWWQKSDYNSFKKAGRLIAKAMMEGGSEIWLANPPSKGPSQIHRSKTDSAALRSYHLSDRSELRQDPGDENSPESFGSKWWCKFGHSRRGLEHIASMDEGRQRQANVKQAVRAVLEEQRRQRLYDHEDEEKLRKVGLQHTLWARDLALAAGAADAESVRSNFSEASKSREFYLLKQVNSSPGKSRQVPAFMDPTSSYPKLDANTSSQIRFRRVSLTVSSAQGGEEKKEDVGKMEAIHDTSSHHSCISRKAAAFGTETKDMAAVLSGMGAVSSEREADPALVAKEVKVGAH